MTVWGIVPAAGIGSRIQPLAFSKELLPVGCRRDGALERPRAVSEYVVERMTNAGADKICVVISSGKADIVEYYGDGALGASFAYVVQREPLGLCDAIFRALPLVGRDDDVVVGLPDTIWFPADGLSLLDGGGLSFLCFPVAHPELFDAVVAADDGGVREIQVKAKDASSRWIWGAFKVSGAILVELCELWRARDRRDAYFGTLVNAWLARGGRARAVRAGESYVDVGTLDGYRRAIDLLKHRSG